MNFKNLSVIAWNNPCLVNCKLISKRAELAIFLRAKAQIEINLLQCSFQDLLLVSEQEAYTKERINALSTDISILAHQFIIGCN